jgi:hypothetical protein
MPTAEYICRSTRPEIIAARNTLADWFSKYPDEHKHELRQSFNDTQDKHHDSAFLELLIHELLIREGWKITIHKPAPNGKKPDFYCEMGDQKIYVEVKDCEAESEENARADKIFGQVLDTVNRKIQHPKLQLSMHTRGIPPRSLSGVTIAEELTKWLGSMQYEQVLDSYRKNLHNIWDNENLTKRFNFDDEECQIEFSVIPTGYSEPDRIVTIIAYGHWHKTGDAYSPFRAAIEKKNSKYGQLDHPLILAINGPTVFDPMPSVPFISLFGNEVGKVDAATGRMRRTTDGAFGTIDKPASRNTSGIIACCGVSTLGFANREVCYIPNDFTGQAPNPFNNIPACRNLMGKMVLDATVTLSSILKLSPDWPSTGAKS